MPRYLFQAKTANGQLTQGELDAVDEQELRLKLQGRKLTLLRQRLSPNQKVNQNAAKKPRVKPKDLQIFTRQMSTLINSGIPVADALKVLSNGMRSGVLKEASSQVKSAIEGGKSLAEAMAAQPHVFDRFFVNMIQAGEKAGVLDTILSRLATYIEKYEKIKSQVKGALIYPGIIMVVAVIVISGLLFFVIPKFEEMYAQSGQQLPGLTLTVLSISHTLRDRWYIFAAVLIGLPTMFLNYIRTDEGRARFERALIEMPVFGEIVLKSSMARMSRTLSTLLSSGVTVVEALEISAKTCGNVVIEETLMRCKDSVVSGKSLASPFSREKLIPDMVTQMISVGESSGTLDSLLSKIADFYEDEVETAVKVSTSLIEPAILMVLGVIIAFLLIAMYMPVFNMAGVQGGGGA